MTPTLALNLLRYRSHVAEMRPLDCIACCGGGLSPVTGLIRIWTGSPFSHIMTVTTMPVMVNGNLDVYVTQSTIDKVNGKKISGIQTSLLSDVLGNEYNDTRSRVYNLSLMDSLYNSVDLAKFNAFVVSCTGKTPYDIAGYLGYGIRDIPIIGTRLAQREDFKRQFCSAWRARILDYLGILRGVDFTEQSPRDIVREYVYRSCTQIWGPPKEIEQDYNTIGIAA